MNPDNPTSREAFLTRVRQAARAGQAFRVHLDDTTAPIEPVGARCDDLCEAMAAEVVDVGGAAHLVDNEAQAAQVITDLLTLHHATKVLTWQHELLDRVGLSGLLQRDSIQQLNHETLTKLSENQQRKQMLECDVGITSCDLAIAETGTLVVCARAGQERVASLVTPVHIAIVSRQQIVPDLFDAFRLLAQQYGDNFPNNVVLITGPSKTGDIEQTLTTGVHGPGHWHMVIIR